MDPSGRIAYIGPDRQVHVVRPDGTGDRAVTFPQGAGSGWGLSVPGRETRSWPCWSPDGRWIACFVHPEGEDAAGPTRLCATEVDGVEERVLADIPEQLPIYCRWSPRGDRLALLTQDGDELQLAVCRLDEIGRHRVVDRGVPMFFTWTPDGTDLVVHAGSRGQPLARLVLRRAGRAGEDAVLPDVPGSFCTPFFIGDRLVYGRAEAGGTALCVGDARGRGARSLGRFQGLVAFVPSPRGDALAVASAPGGDGAPYEDVWLVPLDGGRPRRLVEGRCLAFFWDPTGRRLAVAERRALGLRWTVVEPDAGTALRLERWVPTQEQFAHFYFFEQFAASHPPWSPDGRHIVYAAWSEAVVDGDPEIRVIDLDADPPEPRVVARGRFAVFSP